MYRRRLGSRPVSPQKLLGIYTDCSNGCFAVKEYTDSNGNKVTGPLNVAAAVADSGSHGLSLTDTNTHKQIVLDAVNSGYLSATNSLDSNGVYVIMAGSNVNDSQFCHTNCGYNSYSDEFQYMFIGYPGTCSET